MDKFIQRIATKAGRAVFKRLGKDGAHYYKSEHPGDVVTKADLLSNRIIISGIKKQYPDHGIVSEESAPVRTDAEYVWYIDPIDGTLNFSSGIPFFGVMVGLTRKGKVVLSAVYLPATDELFFAKAGKGAYLNGTKIHCSRMTKWPRSTGTGPSGLRLRGANFLRALMLQKSAQHMTFTAFGSLAVNACYVAAGRRDWIATFGGGVHDYVPISLILKEAGCTITNTKGDPWTPDQFEIVAANPALHKRLLKLTKGI